LLKKFIAVLGALTLSTVGFLPLSVAPASATTSGTLTIVESGGDAFGNGAWGYNGGDRRIDLFRDADINASVIEGYLASGELTLFADEIQINASLDFGTNNLTFKSEGSIRMPGGVTMTSTGGDILFQADSDDSGVGEIRLGTLDTDNGSISSGGGSITLSGGSDPQTGFAMATSQFDHPKPAAGVALFGFDLDAGGGDIVIRASSGGNGAVSTRSFLATSTDTSAISSITTTGIGTVSILGDGSAINHDNAWGVTVEGLNITTDAGDVLVQGEGRLSGNGRGLVTSNLNITSQAGEVLIEDLTDGTGFSYGGSLIGGSITSSAIARIQTDLLHSGNLDIETFSFSLVAQTGTSFVGTTNLGTLDFTGTPTATIGNAANTGNLVVSGITTSDGNVVLNSSGAITQSAKIEAASLGFGSTGSVTLTNAANDVDKIAGGTSANRLGAFNFVDEDGVEIGTVGSLSGLYSSGIINIATTSGDLLVTQPLSSTATSADSVLLYADKDEVADAAGDGNIKLSGSGSISTDATSRGLLYSGSAASSTGLTTAVGGESSTRTSVAATTSLGSISPALGSTGLFALYRAAAPTAPVAPTSLSATSTPGSLDADLTWLAPSDDGGSSITGYKVEVNDGNGWTTAIANTGTAATIATVAGLTIGTSYQFRVFAINAVGTSPASNLSTSITIASAPAPTPYSGPIVVSINPTPITSNQESTATLNGQRLDQITSLTISGNAVTIVRGSAQQLVVKVPALASGTYDLQIVYAGGARLTSQDLVVVGGARNPELDAAQEAVRVVVTGFRPGISQPTEFQVNKLKRAIAAIEGEIVGMTCVGFTNGPTILPADPRVALERGKFVCDYLKTLLPGLPQKLTYKNTTNPSVHWRRAEVYFRVN
jgi:hypothetical protein